MTERWHVLGPGAIGSLFAAYLQRGGSHVVLLDHRNGEDTRRGVAIDGLEPTGHFEFPVSPIGVQQPITHLLVTTKASGGRDPCLPASAGMMRQPAGP